MSRKILIPVDGSENSQRAFDFCMDAIVRPDDILLLLHVQSAPHLQSFSLSEPFQPPTEEWYKKLRGEAEKASKLIGHYEMLCESKKIQKQTLLETGKPGESICGAAKKHSADMIVMGSRGQNAIRRTFVGSVSDYVLHHTHVPITIVPPVEK